MKSNGLTSRGVPKRVAVAFRFKPEVVEALIDKADRLGLSRTAAVEQAIMALRSPRRRTKRRRP